MDRTNFDYTQRKFWVRLAKQNDAAVVVLRFPTPAHVCEARCTARWNHEGGLDGSNPELCKKVVNALQGKFREVEEWEGFDRVIDAEDAAVAVESLQPLLSCAIFDVAAKIFSAETPAPSPPKRARVE